LFVLAMISARQVKAARALLGWSQRALADRAGVSVGAIVRLERGQSDSYFSTVASVQRVLTEAGVRFTSETDGAEGVSLIAPGPGKDER